MDISASALRYFVVAADELHFARAAERLHITPPSLSQQIARLESRLGQRLFVRSPRRVALTEAGEELLPLARDAVRAHESVIDWARSTSPALPTLRVGIVASGAGRLTSEILTSLVTRMPDLRLQLVRLGFFDAAPALREGTVDLALTLAPFSPGEELVASSLVSEPRVLVVRDDSPLAARASVRIDETNDLGFVVPSDATGDALAWWLVDPRPDGTRPRVTAVADDVEGLMELCVAGIGVNIATDSVATHFGRPRLAYPTITDIEPARVLLVRRKRPTHPAVPAFERIAVDVASARAGGTPVTPAG